MRNARLPLLSLCSRVPKGGRLHLPAAPSHFKHAQLPLPTCSCSLAQAAPKTRTPSPPLPLRYCQMKTRKREKKRRPQLTLSRTEEFKSRSRHVGSVLCFPASSVLANSCVKGKGFYRFRDAADALSLTQGLLEKKKQLLTSGAVKDGESALDLQQVMGKAWSFISASGVRVLHQKLVSAYLGPSKLSCHFRTIL